MDREKSCGAVVFINGPEKRFLIIHHRQDHGNHWDFPKGHVESGETEEETAQREVFEETGIKINILKGFRTVISYLMGNGVGKDVVYFLATPINTNISIQTIELEDAKWLTYDEAYNVLTYENATDLLEQANDYLEEHKL